MRDNTLFTSAQTVITNLYTDVSTLVNSLCALALLICIIGSMISNNQKAVDGFREWQKRIIISFVLFNFIGLFMQYGDSLLSSVRTSSSNYLGGGN